MKDFPEDKFDNDSICIFLDLNNIIFTIKTLCESYHKWHNTACYMLKKPSL